MSDFLTKHKIEHSVMEYIFPSIVMVIVGSFFLFLTINTYPIFIIATLAFYSSAAAFIYGVVCFAKIETAARKLRLYKVFVISEWDGNVIFKMATDDTPDSGIAYIQPWHSQKDEECYVGIVQHLEFDDDETYVAKLVKW